MRKLSMLLAAASVAIAVPAMAAFTVNYPSTTAIPGGSKPNNFKTQLNGEGLFAYASNGASITLSEKATLTFHYLASESGFASRFAAGGVELGEDSKGIVNWNAAGYSSFSIIAEAGAISGWTFRSMEKPAVFYGINSEQFGIFVPTSGAGSFMSDVLYFGYDDEPGNDDGNHDDMIIRVTATAFGGPGGGAVPEPASWAMLIAGFGLVGAAQRRRKAVVAA